MQERKVCRCCERPAAAVNQLGLCDECSVCLHCEAGPSVSPLGLCQQCHRSKGLRELYAHKAGWTPEWEQWIRTKAMLHRREMERIERGEQDESDEW